MLASIPATHTNPWAVGFATLTNGTLVLILLSLGLHTLAPHSAVQPHRATIALDDIPFFARQVSSNGGSGGGQRDAVEAMRGRPPQIEKSPTTSPQIPVLDHPRLAIDNAISVPLNVRLPDDPSLPNIGMLHSSNTTIVSGGRGTHNGIGDGDGGRYGNGTGIGFGPGDGDAVYTPGGEISAPVPVATPEAEFSEEARRQKHQGVCVIAVIIDTHGIPRDPRVIQPLGMGLDEKALDAVRRYRFKPALRHGVPVRARITVAVNFQLY